MPIHHFILRDRKLVYEPDLIKWVQWYEQNNKLWRDTLGEVSVSTIFLGFNHRIWLDGPPLYFETMIFGGEHDRMMWRYSTYEQARLGHLRVVNSLREPQQQIRRVK